MKACHYPLLLALVSQLALPFALNAAPATVPPVKREKNDPIELINQHEYRWEDPDGFVGRYQSADGDVTVDVAVNYWKHAFFAKLYTGDAQTKATELQASNDANPAVLVLSGKGGISGQLQKNGTLVLNTATKKGLKLERVAIGKTNFNPPAGATVLLGENTGLEHFRTAKGDKAPWRLLEGNVMESIPYSGSIYSKDAYEDCTFYFEYRLPYNSRQQGNSGVYMMRAYETQVIDSFGKDMADNIAGSLYKISAPSQNMSAPPLEWQAMYIDFTAPRYDAQGKKIANARASVWHNGVQVQDNAEIPHHTVKPTLAEPKGPMQIGFQDHGSYVQFRNMWVMPKQK